MWPDWAIYLTLGKFLKPLAIINLPKSPTFLGNFCKEVKIYHFSSEIILGNFYRYLAIFFWSLCCWRSAQFEFLFYHSTCLFLSLTSPLTSFAFGIYCADQKRTKTIFGQKIKIAEHWCHFYGPIHACFFLQSVFWKLYLKFLPFCLCQSEFSCLS